MPLYEYECTACHKRTEKIQKFSDPEITACPKCGGVLERVLSAPAIAFKGGGWFADGYGNAKPSAASSGSGEGSNTNGAPESKTESKSGSKSESTSSTSDSGTPSTPASAPAAPASAPVSAPAKS